MTSSTPFSQNARLGDLHVGTWNSTSSTSGEVRYLTLITHAGFNRGIAFRYSATVEEALTLHYRLVSRISAALHEEPVADPDLGSHYAAGMPIAWLNAMVTELTARAPLPRPLDGDWALAATADLGLRYPNT